MIAKESIPMFGIEEAKYNRLKQETENYRAELNKRNEKIYEFCHEKEVLEKETKAEKFNFMNLSEKNIKLFCGIVIKTFKWSLGRTKPHVKCYHLQFEDQE